MTEKLSRPTAGLISRRGIFGSVLVAAAVLAAPCRAQTPGILRPLFKIDASGGRPEQFTHDADRICGSPEWSPDGKWIAYDTWRTNEKLQASRVAVISADGSDDREIGHGAMPSWSPDGTQLVCHTCDGSGIVVMNADGSGRETILNHWGSPRWSPRGNRIASIGSQRTIALLDLATGVERSTFGGPYSLWHGFSISPDGRRFCFGDSAQGGVGIATLNERTMQASIRWLVRTGTCYHSSWAPDGRRVVFSWQATDKDLGQLFLMDVDADQAPTPLTGQDKSRNNSDPDWSPDGKTIVYASQPAP